MDNLGENALFLQKLCKNTNYSPIVFYKQNKLLRKQAYPEKNALEDAHEHFHMMQASITCVPTLPFSLQNKIRTIIKENFGPTN